MHPIVTARHAHELFLVPGIRLYHERDDQRCSRHIGYTCLEGRNVVHPPRDRVPSVRDDDAAFRLVELSDGEVRVDRWDGSGSAWVPVPGARLGVIRAGSKLSPAELEARGIHRRTR